MISVRISQCYFAYSRSEVKVVIVLLANVALLLSAQLLLITRNIWKHRYPDSPSPTRLTVLTAQVSISYCHVACYP